jgi:hypothetical protein
MVVLPNTVPSTEKAAVLASHHATGQGVSGDACRPPVTPMRRTPPPYVPDLHEPTSRDHRAGRPSALDGVR